MNSSTSFVKSALGAIALSLLLSGCAVLTVAGAVVGVAATGVGIAADVAVGAVKVTGAVAGAAASAVLPSDDDKKK
ncbi:hypothetical protein [Caenimonas sp. SL110]|uniref:hypothetical protein n=1 Tax=Caenimonas sp. SL110 TaxID=1450524 RepID=UPI00065409BA|nr:hypothetical protein [Caenimonas sp. SL110]